MATRSGTHTALITFLALGVVPYALAQFASCEAGWDWNLNSLNQNPCEVGGMLDASCQGYTTYTVGPLDDGESYLPPATSIELDCECNTVMYSLYQACTVCQNRSVSTWTYWTRTCTAVYVSQLPFDIPQGTAVPHWAYLNITATNNTYDDALAEAAGGSPETLPNVLSTLSASTSQSTASALLGSSSSSSPPSDSTSDSSGSDSSSGGGSNIGAIVGGTLGGLAVLAIAAIAGIIFYRRRTAAAQASASAGASPYKAESGYSAEPGFPPQTAQFRPYDPNDATTYPEPFAGDGSTYYSGVGTTVPPPHLSVGALSKGGYSGAPEI